MRKLLIVAGIVAVVIASPGAARAKNAECRFGTGHRAMRQTIWCVTNKLHTGGEFRRTALYVANRESGFYAGATNSSSGACGIFQHIPSYWPGRYAAFSPGRWGSMGTSCYCGRTNIIVSVHMAMRGGWSPWSM